MNLLRGIRFISLLLASAGAFHALAQSTSLLRGAISDPDGAVVPGAVVTLTNTSTGFHRETLTNPQGEYQFLQIAPGTYRVTVEKTGFKKELWKGIVIHAQAIRETIALVP